MAQTPPGESRIHPAPLARSPLELLWVSKASFWGVVDNTVFPVYILSCRLPPIIWSSWMLTSSKRPSLNTLLVAATSPNLISIKAPLPLS